jgi:hypothetical protein
MKRAGRLHYLYLIKRAHRPAHHRAPYHPVIVCDRKRVALWEAGDTGDRAWVWSAENNPLYGWLLERWEGLDIDYGHVIHNVTLPDGTPTAYYHAHSGSTYEAAFLKLFQGAVWWSDREMPAWIQERGVVYPPDTFTRQHILDFLADDGLSGFNNRAEPSFWGPAAPDSAAGYWTGKEVWRIRRERCHRPGGAIVVHHADIEADTPGAAIEKARKGSVDWRFIDSYDSADQILLDYRVLGPVEENVSKP